MKKQFRFTFTIVAALSIAAPALAFGPRAQNLYAKSADTDRCGTVTGQARILLTGSMHVIPCTGSHPGWN